RRLRPVPVKESRTLPAEEGGDGPTCSVRRLGREAGVSSAKSSGEGARGEVTSGRGGAAPVAREASSGTGGAPLPDTIVEKLSLFGRPVSVPSLGEATPPCVAGCSCSSRSIGNFLHQANSAEGSPVVLWLGVNLWVHTGCRKVV